MGDTILVTGATGNLGRAVLRRLGEEGGPQVRVLSRRPRPATGDWPADWASGELTTGARLAGAVRGVGTIVHCATDPRRFRNDLPAVDHLVAAARAGDAPHLVYISIVGVDRVPFGYYRIKQEVERRVEAAGLPWTILRATQFHNLISGLLRVLAGPPIMLVPAGVSCQPVDVDDVAQRLVGLARSGPAGRVTDLGGPEVRTLADLADAYLRSTGRRRPIRPVPLFGRVYAGYKRGGHLTPEHADGRRTFEEFLAGTRPA
jgi:uncharacterized protein YbjT (DUF2867 family)